MWEKLNKSYCMSVAVFGHVIRIDSVVAKKKTTQQKARSSKNILNLYQRHFNNRWCCLNPLFAWFCLQTLFYIKDMQAMCYTVGYRSREKLNLFHYFELQKPLLGSLENIEIIALREMFFASKISGFQCAFLVQVAVRVCDENVLNILTSVLWFPWPRVSVLSLSTAINLKFVYYRK